MVYSSYIFIFTFLPIVLLVYFWLSRFDDKRIQHIFLVLASLFFYGYTNIYYLGIIISSVLVNYICGLGVADNEKIKKKIIFITGILFNVGLLGYFKYYDFFVENINVVFEKEYTLKHIILPIGISFYTFQQIAFLISVYKKELHPGNFLNYILLVTFFPQLVAGPIVFYQELVPQFQDDKKRFFNIDNFSKGLFIFVIGMFKKAVLADTFALIANNGYDSQYGLTFGMAWVTTLAYTLQIYFDFSGYSEMSLGLAKMFNFSIPINFNSPYKSKSIQEFWKRWHITLGRSLAVLIYFPLGGNRKGLARTCFNLFAVFLVSGIWHGAAWTFVLWGVIYGLLSVFERLFKVQLEKIPSFLRIAATFMWVNALWVLFRSPNFATAANVLKAMFVPDEFSFERVPALLNDGIVSLPDQFSLLIILTLLSVSYLILFLWKRNAVDYYEDFVPTVKNSVITACLFSIGVVCLSRATIFIYFNF
ncbi:MAG TPA: MBOAT family protein [Dysgonomonas sp.]|nr:MBOAT family protein [Dysgonomonas sp.]